MRMTIIRQSELDQQVAKATGEPRATIQGRGFVPLYPVPYERERRPLVVDWDELEQRRQAYAEIVPSGFSA